MLPNDYSDHPSSSIDDDAPFLYPTSTITGLHAVSILISWFSAFPGMSKRSFSRLLLILHFLLPKGNILPTSYNEAISLLNPYHHKVIVVSTTAYCIVIRKIGNTNLYVCVLCAVETDTNLIP